MNVHIALCNVHIFLNLYIYTDVDEQRLLQLAEYQIKQNSELPLRIFKSMFIQF